MEYPSINNEVFGNVAYVCLAISYFLTNIFWLRVMAVVSMFLEMVYFKFSGGDLTTGLIWNTVFVLINLYQLYWLTRDRLSLQIPEADAPMLRSALAELDDSQIARLLKAAHWKSCDPGEILTHQNKPVDELFFLCSGRAHVMVNDAVVAHLDQGAFVGEIAYLTGNHATATVMVQENARVLAFSRSRLAKVVAADSHINGLIYQLLGRDLAMKMGRANTRHAVATEAFGRI